MNNIYKIENLRYGYDSTFNLHVPELEIKEGTITGFSGPNGSGKSTFFRLLAFLESPQEGTIYFNTNPVHDITLARNEVTFLLQNPYLLKRSVFENVAYGLRRKKRNAEIRHDVFEALKWVALDPKKYAKRNWHQLSGGEAQRVALAARLVLKPRVLILDEPVASNDPMTAEHIRTVIKDIRERFNTTILISSHDMLWLGKSADEIIRMHDGMIISTETENIISGPWKEGDGGIWFRDSLNGEMIYSTRPPDVNSQALLEPSDIIVSVEKPALTSAHNLLPGTISSMHKDTISGKIRLKVDTGELSLDANITGDSALKLNLLPGKKVWLIFKASSLRWS